MLFADVIQKKRDGGELTAAEIEFFVKGLADSSIPAEQVSALAMAIVFESMTFEETAALTTTMASSGTVLAGDSSQVSVSNSSTNWLTVFVLRPAEKDAKFHFRLLSCILTTASTPDHGRPSLYTPLFDS